MTVAALNSPRNAALESVREFLQRKRLEYQSCWNMCQNWKEDCDAMVLGHIVKIQDQRFLDDSPRGKFHRTPLVGVVSMLGNQRLSNLCNGCGIRLHWTAIIDDIKRKDYTLNLSDFTTPPRKDPPPRTKPEMYLSQFID